MVSLTCATEFSTSFEVPLITELVIVTGDDVAIVTATPCPFETQHPVYVPPWVIVTGPVHATDGDDVGDELDDAGGVRRVMVTRVNPELDGPDKETE